MWKTVSVWLLANSAPIVIIVLVLVLLIVLVWKIDTIKTFLPKHSTKPIRRSCSDCMMIAYGIWLRHDAAIDKIKHNIIEHQMRFVEQKIEEYELLLLQDYKKDQVKKRKENIITKIEHLTQEHKEYILYQEALHNAFRLIIKEIRRSYKENGFYNLHAERFASYVKNKAKDLIRIGEQYMMSVYPQEHMFIAIEKRFQKLDERQIEDLTFEIYINAKTTYNEAHKQMTQLEKQFQIDIDKHIGG